MIGNRRGRLDAQGNWRPAWPPSEELAARIPDLIVVAESRLAPGSADVVLTEMVKMWVVQRRRSTEGADDAFVQIYFEELRDIPGDVLGIAGRAWRRKSPWFPTIHEWRGECQPTLARRRRWLYRLYMLGNASRLSLRARPRIEDPPEVARQRLVVADLEFRLMEMRDNRGEERWPRLLQGLEEEREYALRRLTAEEEHAKPHARRPWKRRRAR